MASILSSNNNAPIGLRMLQGSYGPARGRLYVHFLTGLGPLTHGLIFLTRFY